MKKILVMMALIGSVFMFQGCDSDDYLTPEQKVELLSTYYPDIFDSIKGDDGDSAYQVAVDNGFEGTVEDWLQSLVGADGEDGADGVDGVCPDCTDPVEPVCDPCLAFDQIDDNDTDVRVVAYFKREDLDGFTMQHYMFNGTVPILVSSHDVVEGGEGNFVKEDCNGTTFVKGKYELDHNETAVHALGIQFEQTVPEVVEPVEPVEPVEAVLPIQLVQ